jgi:hypothetical protein
MQLLVDTDVFCKLGVANLFDEALISLGVEVSECRRLPALPHMLRRGRLPKTYGAETCMALVPVAECIPAIGSVEAEWLDRLAPVRSIDPGEAQLFAMAAQKSLFVLSGDKRAIRAIKDVPDYAEALSGRIVVLEAVLMLLCDRMDPSNIRRRLRAVTGKDTMVDVCFSEGNQDPRGALVSYYRCLADEVYPLVLWAPRNGGCS